MLVILITLDGVPLSFMLVMRACRKYRRAARNGLSVDGANPMQRLLHNIPPLMKDHLSLNLIRARLPHRLL
jgi:ABC-type sugar transport system permease subunit